MLLAFLLSLTSVTSLVAAAPLRTRSEQNVADIKAAISVIDRISTGVSKVGLHVKLWKGDLDGANEILNDLYIVVSDQYTGARYIENSPTLGLFEAPQLISPLTSLVNIVDRYATGMIAKKSFVEGLSMVPQFMDMFERSRMAALDVARVITQKLPGVVEWAAIPATDQIIERLDKVIKAYGGGQSQGVTQSLQMSKMENLG